MKDSKKRRKKEGAARSLTLSHKLKLLPAKEQKDFLLDYFSRFARAVNFFVSRIYEKLRGGYKRLLEEEEEQRGCMGCKEERTLTHRVLQGNDLICIRCYDKKVSDESNFRELFASDGRKRGRYDVRDVVKLSGTEYELAWKRAVDTLKSAERRFIRVKNKIKRTQEELRKWREVLGNKEILLEDGKKIEARIRVPIGGNRSPRFKHYEDRETRSTGKTEKVIQKEVEVLEKTIQRLRKELKETVVSFRGNVLDLDKATLTELKDESMELDFGGRKETFSIEVEKVRSSRGKVWMKESVTAIKKDIDDNRRGYPSLLKHGEEIYFCYPLRVEVETLRAAEETKIMGIDIGVQQVAVTVVLDKPKGKPRQIRFYPGRYLERVRGKQKRRADILALGKNPGECLLKRGKRVSRIVKQSLHNISRKIVNEALNLQPIAIAMEKIEFTPEKRKVEKKPFDLTHFAYARLRKFIKYKANLARIPVLFVSPEYTSQVCYRCGQHAYPERGTRKFKCPRCNQSIDRDLNAAINIANSGFDLLQKR